MSQPTTGEPLRHPLALPAMIALPLTVPGYAPRGCGMTAGQPTVCGYRRRACRTVTIRQTSRPAGVATQTTMTAIGGVGHPHADRPVRGRPPSHAGADGSPALDGLRNRDRRARWRPRRIRPADCSRSRVSRICSKSSARGPNTPTPRCEQNGRRRSLGPRISGRYSTISLPSMPPWRWPGTEQRNLYSPAWSRTSISDVPPSLTIGPSSRTPLPSKAMLWSGASAPSGVPAASWPGGAATWAWAPPAESDRGCGVSLLTAADLRDAVAGRLKPRGVVPRQRADGLATRPSHIRARRTRRAHG